MVLTKDQDVKKAANKSCNLRAMLDNLNYACTRPGGNTDKKLKRILGKRVYNEIKSGNRIGKPMTKWTKVK